MERVPRLCATGKAKALLEWCDGAKAEMGAIMATKAVAPTANDLRFLDMVCALVVLLLWYIV